MTCTESRLLVLSITVFAQKNERVNKFVLLSPTAGMLMIHPGVM